MAEKITDYVLRLAHNPRELLTFKKDPDKAMTLAGLSTEQRAVLTSKDPVAIRNSFVSDLSANLSADYTWVVVVVEVRAVPLEV